MTDPPYPRRILLAVTGLTPQVITETLYALAIQRQPAFIPTDIHPSAGPWPRPTSSRPRASGPRPALGLDWPLRLSDLG
jgi:hypothetical protein